MIPTLRPPNLTLLIALAFAPAVVLADESENRKRLEAMPRERRAALAENLDRFDKLDPAEQARIRQLESDLARLEPGEAERYRQVSKRYHLWVNTLTDDQKRQLRDAPGSEARLALALKFRGKANEDPAKALPRLSGIRIGEYGMVGPYEAAHLLRVWNALSSKEQADLARLGNNAKIRARLWQMGPEKGIRLDQFAFDKAEEKKAEAELEADADFLKMLGPLAQDFKEKLRLEAEKARKGVAAARAEVDRATRAAAKDKSDQAREKVEQADKKLAAATELANAAAIRAANSQRRFEHPFAEFLYFEKYRPQSVLSKNFERFATHCPGWFLEMVEPLAPDDARDYLTIIYRLLYPRPNEMPDPAAAPPKPRGDAANKPPQGPKGPSRKPQQQGADSNPF